MSVGAGSSMSEAEETFRCRMCLGVMESTVVLCTHCRRLIGCSGCVQLVQATPNGRCPNCRARWGPYSTQQIRGLDDFLQTLPNRD